MRKRRGVYQNTQLGDPPAVSHVLNPDKYLREHEDDFKIIERCRRGDKRVEQHCRGRERP